jgi:hypothetical protein
MAISFKQSLKNCGFGEVIGFALRMSCKLFRNETQRVSQQIVWFREEVSLSLTGVPPNIEFYVFLFHRVLQKVIYGLQL